jgi:chromosomal replication initiator protein
MFANAAEFARELADAIETQAVDEFRRRYRTPALLVLEDLDWLQNKPAAQQEFQHTLDTLLRSGRRVVLTSHHAPARLTRLSPALRSRLSQGLTVALAIPESRARRVLVRRFAEQQGISLDEESVNALGHGLRGPASELWGALMQLQAEAESEGGSVNLEAVRNLVAHRNQTNTPPLQHIASTTARYFSVRVSDMRSPTRRRPVVTARGVAMYLARLLTNESFRQIGQYFGGRDHTTILHGYRKTERLLKTEPQIQKAVFDLQEKLTNS